MVDYRVPVSAGMAVLDSNLTESCNMRSWTARLMLIAFLGFQHAFAHSPTGIVVDKEGSVYFLKFLIGTADKNCSQLWKLDPDGTLTNIPVARDGRRLSRPHKLAIDSSGTL